MKKSEKILNRLVLIAGLGMIAYYLLLGICVRFGQSLQFLWLLAGLVCIARFCYWSWADRRGKCPKGRLLVLLRCLLAACIVLFLAGELVIFSAGLTSTPQDLDYIVVLGAKVNGREPSGVLRNRIDVAAEYLEENPNTIAILSGGQGADEEISEAQCMYERLTAKGIDPARLILEEKSTDTRENLRFSRELIAEDNARVGIVTNNFHLFRALALARGMGWNVSGVSVATSLLSFPHYMMREFIGVAYDALRGNLALSALSSQNNGLVCT